MINNNINNNELMQIEFWQDADRITNYCYSILNHVVKNHDNIITVNLQNREAFVRNIDDTAFQIYLPTIDVNASENIKKEIYMRAYFLRHELAHVIYSRELREIGYEMLKQKNISLQQYNYLEDIRIEKKFSKQFKGSFSGFKTLRYIHFVQDAALRILKYPAINNFLAYIIYRSYGFNFNLKQKHELLDLYESAFQKICNRLNDTSVVNYIEITEILINIYKQNQDAISRMHKESIKHKQNAVISKISKQDINDLDIDMLQAMIAPNVLEKLLNNETIYDEKDEDEYDENNAAETTQNLDTTTNNDNDNCQNITSNDDDMVIEPASGHIKIANNKPNLELLNNFKNVVDEEVDNASFAFIKTAKLIDLQELLDNFTIKRKKMPFDSNNPILLNKYNAIVNLNKQAILRLSIFLKQKAQNKIIRKIMPHQLDGEVDETNITDIFVSHEPRIFKKESYFCNTKDNNIIILVDFSGSMFTANRINGAIETLIQIYEASQIANFNIEIYGFSSIYYHFKAKSKTNVQRFANKYNLNLSTTIKNNKQVNMVTIGGPILWKVLDTKTMRGINDSIAKKKFLANLYEATAAYKTTAEKEKYLFSEIAGETPEVVCLSSLYRILKNNINTNNKNILFVLNDGKFSDGHEMKSQSINLLSDDNYNYQTLMYYPNLMNDLFDLHEKYNLTIFNANNALFDFLAPEVYREIASSVKHNNEIVTSQTNNIWKKAANEFCIFFNKMNSMLNNEQNYKKVTLEQALQIFSIDELTQYHVIDLNKKHVVFLTKHDFEIDNNKFRLYGTLLKAPDKNEKNKIINLFSFKLVKLNSNMEIAQCFEKNLFISFLKNLLYNARSNLFYLIYGAMIKNIGCKAITIGIDSAAGAKYNNNFIYINNAANAGYVIAKQLEEML